MPGSRGSCRSTDPITSDLELLNGMRDVREFVGEVVQRSDTLEKNVHIDVSYSLGPEAVLFR